MAWRDDLTGDPVPWLLEEDDPSARYFTLVGLLAKGGRSPEARRARRDIMATGPVPAILARQRPDGGWVKRLSMYHAKYRGTVWSLLLLAELGADARHPQVRRACDYVLDNSWSPESGGFSTRAAERGGREDHVIPCLTGNMVFSLVRLGRARDERVKRSVDWLAKYLRADEGGAGPPAGFRYRHEAACYGRHSCFHGVVKGLKALAELPESLKTPPVRRCIKRCGEFMLRHRVYRSSRNPRRIGRPGWASLGFPRMWDTDALEILDILLRLGFRDERMADAVGLVLRKQDDRGRWRLEQSWNGKMQVEIEKKGQPSKWITLRALQAIRAWSG